MKSAGGQIASMWLCGHIWVVVPTCYEWGSDMFLDGVGRPELLNADSKNRETSHNQGAEPGSAASGPRQGVAGSADVSRVAAGCSTLRWSLGLRALCRTAFSESRFCCAHIDCHLSGGRS